MQAPVQTLVVSLDAGASDEGRERLLDTVEAMLPALDWRGHVVVVGDPTQRGAALRRDIASAAARHLARTPIASLHLHPALYLGHEEGWRHEIARLTALRRGLDEEAYRERSDPRLCLHPLVVAGADTPPEAVSEAVRALHARAATPSVLVPEGREELATAAAAAGPVRLHRGLAAPANAHAILALLAAAHVTDSVVERMDDGETLASCRPHLVLDERLEGVFPCFEARRRRTAATSWERCLRGHPGLPDATAGEWCPGCTASSLLAGAGDLAASGSRGEAHRACLAAARAFAVRKEHASAARLAARAAETAADDDERAAALLLAGLAHLSAGDLAKAEEALGRCRGISDDSGRLAYHRGEVQFAWRDWIEALERYEEALQSPSPTLPPAYVHFRMALCHINLEEYAEARGHLEATWAAQPAAPVAFYRGVCALNEGSPEVAIVHLRTALELGPEAEDLGRVLFYQAAALKELERWEEAVEVLRRAAPLDPDDLPILNLLGFCLYTLKRHEEAVACFHRAVEIAPRSAIDWANLGSNLREVGRIEEAIAAYRRALELDPTIDFARTNLERLRAAHPAEM